MKVSYRTHRKQIENRNKTFQQNRNSMLMNCETGTLIPDCITIGHYYPSKTDIHEREEQLNKRICKKPMVEQNLLQNYIYTREYYLHWTNRLLKGLINDMKITKTNYTQYTADEQGCLVEKS